MKQQIHKSVIFDIEEPTEGHFERFKTKLHTSNKHHKSNRIYKYIAIAACGLLLISIGFQTISFQQKMELADVSNQMKKTQQYFTATIEKELKNIALYEDNSTHKLILDSKNELKRLENDYEKLTVELSKNKYDKRIVHAMIYNFQQRIQILEDLQLKIESIKNLKKQLL